jgi:hypothetical protein
MRTSRLSRLVAVTGFSLASLAFAGSAFADDPSDSDIAQARQLGTQAQEQMDKGNFAESEKLWTAAAKLYSKAPTLTLGLARAAAKNGHPLLAQENYNKIIREWGNVASPPPAFKDALDAARAEVGSVSSRIASVVITVEGVDKPSVMLDGEAIPPVTLGLKRPIEPGKHMVHAEAQGYKPADLSFTVAEGGAANAPVKLEKAPDAPVAGPTPGTPPGTAGGTGVDTGAGPTPGHSSNKTYALVAFGVGGAGLVVGAITGIIAVGKHSDLDKQCTGGTCSPDLQSKVDSYKTMGTISTVGFIVAGVGAAAGAILWFTAPKETASGANPKWATFEAKGVKMTPYVGLTNAGVTGSF